MTIISDNHDILNLSVCEVTDIQPPLLENNIETE
jgi:hypothetical protein